MLSRELRELLEDIGKLVLRLGMGIPLLALHGWPKLTGWSSILEKGFADPLLTATQATDVLPNIAMTEPVALALAIVAELVCAVLVIVGLGTRAAGVVITGLFVVIIGIVHAGDPWADVRLAYFYFVLALAITTVGPGRISADAIFGFIRDD